MKFSIGYNEKIGFEDILLDYADNISSVYFPLPADLGVSGRPVRQNEGNYKEKVINLLLCCKELSIDTILLLNSTIESNDAFCKNKLLELINYIDFLITKGLTSISVTNMVYMKILKKKFPNLKYFSSVNCRLKNVEHSIFLKKLGINVLTLDRDINRDIELIKKIKIKTGLELQIMLNEPCIKNCPFRSTHFEAVAYNNEQIFSGEFEDYTCYPMIKENKRIFFRIPFIRPEDLIYYESFIKHYKLVTRDANNEKIRYMLDAYISKSFNGNLIDLFDIEPSQYLSKLNIDNNKLNSLDFFNKIKNCPGDCDTCNLCDIFLK